MANYLSAKEAAKILGVHVRTLSRWADKGLIRAHRTGGVKKAQRRYDVDDYLARNSNQLAETEPEAAIAKPEQIPAPAIAVPVEVVKDPQKQISETRPPQVTPAIANRQPPQPTPNYRLVKDKDPEELDGESDPVDCLAYRMGYGWDEESKFVSNLRFHVLKRLGVGAKDDRGEVIFPYNEEVRDAIQQFIDQHTEQL